MARPGHDCAYEEQRREREDVPANGGRNPLFSYRYRS
ncbi:hypothetical protein Rrhod_4258 [Rhodococcus rhodnii LMG 5362]|uniref:Uncharacterized protein n=1 Tax=Rhodococcus rhodnii LMG 5362 TaxID=1273125 RepID=R7WH92_9NOCA|nr:hypothetical protein Rrhod_4258 [Rhodococcus rhodnii LMG 5362]